MNRETPERRRVREAAERARWQADFAARRHGSTPRSGAERRPWHPTQAEVRFLSREALDQQWRYALRRAAAAQFPKQTVELRSAAYLAAHLVVGERLAEDVAMGHLHAVAERAGVSDAQAERTITDAYLQGRAHAFGELSHGGIKGHPPGAFSAIASASTTYDHDNRFHVDPAALTPLPAAVLVHVGHNLDKAPVAVGVPALRGGVIHVDAVLPASTSIARPVAPGPSCVRSVFEVCRSTPLCRSTTAASMAAS